MALRGSKGVPGAWQKLWLECTDKCLDHQAMPNAERRKDYNLGQECLHRRLMHNWPDITVVHKATQK